ncbi:ORF6N domain-containing protein [bacterium]|nr:ORF6N domain-containing protein [bacterium]MBU1615720.1 ORF6N domain-containing protein [bacterium]
MSSLVPIERIEGKILLIRGQKVMLDRDLAELYGVKTKALKQAVRRNIKRFPDDFMFELTKEEFENWRSQFVTSNSDKMGLRYVPMAFTEQGVAMLSSVLNSERAILVNIQIMRAFTKLRQMLATNEEFRKKMEDVGRKIEEHDIKFEIVFEVMEKLISPPAKEIKIGFRPDKE